MYFHFRLFGPGNGHILGIIFFCCLFILENRLNYDDETMVMQKVWYPLLYMVPAFIGNVSAKICQYFDRLPLHIPFFLLAMYTFIIVGIVIPSSMINRSKKCKEFVLKKILTPFLICRNLQWIEINKNYFIRVFGLSVSDFWVSNINFLALSQYLLLYFNFINSKFSNIQFQKWQIYHFGPNILFLSSSEIFEKINILVSKRALFISITTLIFLHLIM